MNHKNPDQDWLVPNAPEYIEDAERLRRLAAEAQTLEAKLELEHLAQLYESLAHSTFYDPEGNEPISSAEAVSSALIQER